MIAGPVKPQVLWLDRLANVPANCEATWLIQREQRLYHCVEEVHCIAGGFGLKLVALGTACIELRSRSEPNQNLSLIRVVHLQRLCVD